MEKKITRKEAIKKTGLMAASTATMMILLNSKKAQATSASCPRTQGKGHQNHSHSQHPHQDNNRGNGPWKSNNNKGGNK